MAFFSRPNLDNEQFKQISGSTLTLSGTTQIATVSGFTLTDGAGSNIIVTAEGAGISGQVLAYDGAGKIRLADPSSGASTGIYTCASPTTCTVGGLNACTDICNWQIDTILQAILVPTLCSDITEPWNTFTITCSPTTSTGYYEMGATVCVTGCSRFYQGIVDPAYCGGPAIRSGLPVYHCYGDWGIGVVCITTNLNNSIGFTPYQINNSSQSVSGRVFYSAGSVVLMSDGNPQPSGMTFSNPLPSGSTSSINRSVLGTYPYFYGITDSVPVAGSALLTGGTKCVCLSSGNVAVNFNATNKYLWLAIPSGTTKVRWTGSNSVTNTESIPGGLFPAKINQSVNSPTSGYWSGVTYNFYISNYKTSTYEGITPYTITFTNS